MFGVGEGKLGGGRGQEKIVLKKVCVNKNHLTDQREILALCFQDQLDSAALSRPLGTLARLSKLLAYMYTKLAITYSLIEWSDYEYREENYEKKINHFFFF